MDIAIVGTGNMGVRIAGLLVKAGHNVRSYDPSPKAQEDAQNCGAHPCSSVVDAVGAANFILLSLPKPEHVRTALQAETGIFSAIVDNVVIIDTSTVDPGTSIEMAEIARKRGGKYLDAPILGRPEGIGNWVMPVGGETDAYEKAKPILDLIAKQTFHLGSVGSGNKLKLINQLMFASVNMVYCEVFALAEKCGIGANVFFDILSESGASTVNQLFREIGRRIVEDDFEPDFSVDLLVKDLNLSADYISSFGGATSITGLSLPLANMAQAAGFGKNDNAALYSLFVKHFQGETK